MKEFIANEYYYITRTIKCVAFLMLFGGTQIAHANLITNGSFESPTSNGIPSLSIGSTYLTGWTVINAEIAQEGPAFPTINSSNGNYSLDLTGYHDSAPYGGVEQVIATIPFAVYNISFDVGALSGTSAVQVLVSNLLNTGFSTSASEGVVWTTFTSIFTALSPTTTIDLIGTQSSWNGVYIGLDNVIVELDHQPNQIPEPTSIALLASGLLGLGTVRRKTNQVKVSKTASK